MAVVTAVVVDNGEPLLETCLESLKDQTERVYTVVVGGDRTDYELAKSLADEVYGPIDSIGVARVYGVLKAKSEYVLSCDSDTWYSPRYAEEAVKALNTHGFVKAGTIRPWKPNPLGELEIRLLYPFVPYEHTLAFRRSAFISAGLHESRFRSKREDICNHIILKGIPVISVRSMELVTRVPTRFFKTVVESGALMALLSLPIAGVASEGVIRELGFNWLKLV